MRPEITSAAGGTLIRMVRILMHGKRLAEESSLERHRQTWRLAKAELMAALGANPVTIVATCAVSGVGRMVARTAFSVDGRTLRWRSAADDDALRSIAGSSGLLE